MDDKFSGQLDHLLQRYEKRRSEEQVKVDSAEHDSHKFLNEFATWRATIGYPLFTAVADHLRKHGHDCDIWQPDYEVSTYGVVRDTSLTLTVYPAGMTRESRPIHEFPSLSIVAVKRTQLVRIERLVPTFGRNLQPAPQGEIKLKLLTSELVQREILLLLGDVFGTPRHVTPTLEP